MIRTTNLTRTLSILGLFSLMAACGDDSTVEPNAQPAQDDDLPPLVDVAAIKPSNDGYDQAEKADYAAKFDITLPKQYFDLLEKQSPVRNQASRGVCSIFSTIGLMESLYITEGTITNPDFSEQHLQWVTKVKVKAFQNTSGSSAQVNLDGINRFGVVEESTWPYEGRPWSSSNLEDCGKDEKERPVACFTNGDPSEEVLSAKHFYLPAGRYQSTRTQSMKTYLFKEKKAIIAGMDFFYQSWNHGGSKLGINQDQKLRGVVGYPSAEDKEDSLQRRAGHSILIVGYDDERTEVQLDKDGKPKLNENGEPVYEKGFFLFKNSWGASGSWGSKNEQALGYGWLSYRYVEEYARAQSAGLPVIKKEEPKVEICGDGLDNDGNGDNDCEDAACAAETMCQPGNGTETRAFEDVDAIVIPDNDSKGISRSIESDLDGLVSNVILDVEVEHTWIGDVSIILEGPSGEIAIVKEADGASGEGFKKQLVLEQFKGKMAKGTWTLHVADESRYDSGELKGWTLTITN